MTITNLMPIRGIDNLSEDAALHQGGKEPFTFVRDAVNVNVLSSGGIESRGGATKVTILPYKHLWQNPVHKDVFAVLGGAWVKIDPAAWDATVLAEQVGEGDAYHLLLNNQVILATPNGLWVFNGSKAQSLTIPTPPPPRVAKPSMGTAGKKDDRKRWFAVSWVKDGAESALSNMTEWQGGAEVTAPPPNNIDGVNIYATNVGGTELQLVKYSTEGKLIIEPDESAIGTPPPFENMSPMPTGRHLCYWRGRIITATANMLRFSEPLAYHIHDELAGFVMMPQRVTFVQPVEGGIWVGQSDHVAFLQGDSLEDMSVVTRSSHSPIEGSAIAIKANEAGEVSEGGQPCALWLASNGFVIGNSAGQIFEVQGNRLGNIGGQVGVSVILGKRIVTTVS